MDINKDNLTEKQKRHLDLINKRRQQVCMHDQCSNCYGTGIDHMGKFCIHMISCPCPKCTPIY